MRDISVTYTETFPAKNWFTPQTENTLLNLGLLCFDGLESPIHMSIIFAYSWSSQNPGTVVRKKINIGRN